MSLIARPQAQPAASLYLNGALVEGQGPALPVHYPYTGEVIATLHEASPDQVAEATAALPLEASGGAELDGAVALLDRRQGGEEELDDTATLVVRDKTHEAAPMTTEDALHEMELVGHDFFLFFDRVQSLPSVVYRRHGYDYGVIRLATP